MNGRCFLIGHCFLIWRGKRPRSNLRNRGEHRAALLHWDYRPIGTAHQDVAG